jgi:hypothetical protein
LPWRSMSKRSSAKATSPFETRVLRLSELALFSAQTLRCPQDSRERDQGHCYGIHGPPSCSIRNVRRQRRLSGNESSCRAGNAFGAKAIQDASSLLLAGSLGRPRRFFDFALLRERGFLYGLGVVWLPASICRCWRPLSTGTSKKISRPNRHPVSVYNALTAGFTGYGGSEAQLR